MKEGPIRLAHAVAVQMALPISRLEMRAILFLLELAGIGFLQVSGEATVRVLQRQGPRPDFADVSNFSLVTGAVAYRFAVMIVWLCVTTPQAG